jgi:sedoheptulokinase
MFLGIDIGTSKIAAVIAEADGRAAAVSSRSHSAELSAPPGRSEQDARVLLESAWTVVKELPEAERSRVRGIGVTGQMHGVMLLDAAGDPMGPLITWKDMRCREGNFLSELAVCTGKNLSSGYGCATLAWLASHGGLSPLAAHCATIQDWAVMRLCGLSHPVTDPTDAASWGLFDAAAARWDGRAVEAAGIPEGLLPEVVPCGRVVGRLTPVTAVRIGVPPGVPVAVAIGDNQASMVATLQDPERELALTLGTGGQLSAVLPAGIADEPEGEARASYELRPYPGGRRVAVAAGLCGGAAWKWLASSIRSWLAALRLPDVSQERIFAAMNELGLSAPAGLTVRPHFMGERFDPGLRGSIEGIGLDDFSLGSVARALAAGICENLRGMMPETFRAGRLRLSGSGNALALNPLLRHAAEEAFGIPLVMSEVREEAALGAALVAARGPDLR